MARLEDVLNVVPAAPLACDIKCFYSNCTYLWCNGMVWIQSFELSVWIHSFEWFYLQNTKHLHLHDDHSYDSTTFKKTNYQKKIKAGPKKTWQMSAL